MPDDMPSMFTGQPMAPGASKDKRVDYPHPWLDYASRILPKDLSTVLEWAEFIWLTNGTYRQACQRTARYFITNLIFSEVDDKQSKELKETFVRDLGIVEQLSIVGDTFLTYGNVFVHVYVPFLRRLQCHCGFFTTFDEADRAGLFEWKDFKAVKTAQGCPQCKAKNNHIPWMIKDTQEKEFHSVSVKLLSPHQMRIEHNPYSGRKVFYWKIPANLKEGVKKGQPIILRDLSMELIEAIAGGHDEFEFDEGVIFHRGDPAPVGVETGGWGLPRVMSNFRLAFHYQVLNRFDQAIAMDYINAMRVISPDQSTGGAGAGDPLIGSGGSQFSANVQKMVEKHRKDPNTWHTSPIPLKYQLFGGEGTQLSPQELIRAKLDEWLDATGIPAELFHGSLSIQAMPTALRVFENSWPEIVALYNNLLSWLGSYAHNTFDLPEFDVKLQPVRLADDMERRHIMLQLMAGQQVSPQTALNTFGVDDPREEIRRTFEWQRMMAEEEKDFEDDMMQAQELEQIKQEWGERSQMAQQGGAPMDPAAMGMGGAPPPGGGMPPMGGGGLGVPNEDALSTPESMQGEAQRLAEEIISMEASARRSALIELKKSNEVLHALVRQRIEDMEQDAKQQGVTMMRQQGQMM